MNIKENIEKLIKNNEICLFMKGTPDAPQCGFSLAVSNVLKHLEVNFKGIDILAGWYGIVIIPMLVNRLGYDIPINIYDIDEYTCDIAQHIYKDEFPQVTINHKDVVFDSLELKGNVVINCSCEHMMDMKHITNQYPDKLYVLQSNNNKNVKWLHINCADGAGELATQGHLRKVYYGESREFLGAKRIMVIGKVNKNENDD